MLRVCLCLSCVVTPRQDFAAVVGVCFVVGYAFPSEFSLYLAEHQLPVVCLCMVEAWFGDKFLHKDNIDIL